MGFGMKSIISNDQEGVCYLCGSHNGIQEHHIFGGPDRKVSERYGLKVHLCYLCHDRVHGKNGKALMQQLHEIGQRAYEETRSRENFRKEFRKSYL